MIWNTLPSPPSALCFLPTPHQPKCSSSEKSFWTSHSVFTSPRASHCTGDMSHCGRNVFPCLLPWIAARCGQGRVGVGHWQNPRPRRGVRWALVTGWMDVGKRVSEYGLPWEGCVCGRLSVRSFPVGHGASLGPVALTSPKENIPTPVTAAPCFR